MKKNLIFLFLLTVFCIMSVFTQEKSADKEKPITEFVKLKNLRFPLNLVQTSPYKPSGYWGAPTKEQEETFHFMFHSLLSEKGSVEIDSRSNILIITDTKNRVEFTKEFVAILDNSGFTFDEFVSKSVKNDEKLITETVKAQNIFPIIICYGFAYSGKIPQPLWAHVQGNLLVDILPKLLSVNGRIEFGKEEAVLTETESRFSLMKKLIVLFDQPYLIEEFKDQ